VRVLARPASQEWPHCPHVSVDGLLRTRVRASVTVEQNQQSPPYRLAEPGWELPDAAVDPDLDGR
jgi:hypothetical protein